ncbi:hypothetical protein P43SY_001934 [Pythium insidiosum]|uniref:Mitochondrial Carrier (MC) Family n=1 Tax=Pythium insidiosum TaxID=114742 RepID=A0AAD5QCG7_PYTIN|nr:hypothetical protein P43SY_001934 [Pythium insidiosum]KAJ0411940.1 hypothetical protein ATCC90586_009897 [Pythium insidiosum]
MAAAALDASRAAAEIAAAPKPPKAKKLAAGALSGMVSALAFQPLDVLRTHQQGAFGSDATAAPSALLQAPPRRMDRVRAMWRGTSPTLIRVAGGAGLYFVTLDHLLQASPATSLNTFLSGAFARTFAGCVMSPFTIIKARMEWHAPGTESSNLGVLRHVLREEGVRGLYRGMVPTLIRDVPFSGLYVLLYKRVQQSAAASSSSLPPYAVNFGSGVVAGVLATSLVHPADVVKTRMQLTIMTTGADGVVTTTTNSLSLRDTVRKIWRDEGWRGFAKGVVPRVLKRTLSTAVTWTIYEQLSVR